MNTLPPHTSSVPWPRLRRGRRKSLLALLLLAAIVLGAVYGRFWDWDTLATQEARLRTQIASHPVGGTLIGFIIYTLLCFVPGAGGKSLVVGWLFGFWSALVQVNVGLTLVAITTFCVSRYLIYDVVQRRFGSRIARLDRAMAVDGPQYLFALRVLHVPYTLTNYALGATSMRTRDFWWATQLGMLPGNIAFVYAGAHCPSLVDLSQQGLSSIFTGPLLTGLAAIGLLPLATRVLWRKWHSRRR